MKSNIITLFFVIITPCFAKIEVELGLKATRFFIENIYSYKRTDSIPIYFNVDWAYEKYWGMSGEILISFVRNLYLRIEMIEIKKFDEQPFFYNYGYGGSGLNIFSNLDADFIYILPFWYRISPLLYCGVNLENFYGKPPNDIRSEGATYEYRIGTGLNYRVTKKINLFSEIQAFTCFRYTKRVPLVDATYTAYYELLGLGRINLGCRFRL